MDDSLLQVKKYQVVCYMRIEPENSMPPSYEKALEDKKEAEFLQSQYYNAREEPISDFRFSFHY